MFILDMLGLAGVNIDDPEDVACWIKTLSLPDNQKTQLIDMYEKASGRVVTDTQKQGK